MYECKSDGFAKVLVSVQKGRRSDPFRSANGAQVTSLEETACELWVYSDPLDPPE